MFRVELHLGSVQLADLTGNAKCASDRVALARGTCGCRPGYFQLSLQAAECEACSSTTTSAEAGAVGRASEACNVCAEGYYRPSASDDVSKCKSCLTGARCAVNATLSTLTLREGYWRLAPSSTKISECANLSSTACLGGSHSGTCGPEYAGPMCAECLDAVVNGERKRQYYESGKGCVHCDDATRPVLVCVAVVIFVGVVLIGLHRVLLRPTEQLLNLSITLHQLIDVFMSFGWAAKLRIGVAWYQCVIDIGPMFDVKLPPEYTDFMDAFNWLDIDWAGIFLPAACVGTFEHRMVLTAIAPLVLIALIVVGQLAAARFKRRPLIYGLFASMTPCLLIIFLFAPS
eukprot:1973110-Prymnesium_polylepis.1